ncbi:amidohydrolase [Algimonas arctica]|uniref:Amidohydrolase n=1 Tax=Algimonas arctica TaxID=1479486 RepID=A0A8J3CTC3_9PROT|nr:amidohydrolase family protein [Algimonas arctica]GHB03152.1 amidohydrolase [Algimonas arctica]
MKHLLLASVASLLTATSAFAQDMFLDNVTVLASDGTRQTADIQMRDGMITAMGPELAATDGSTFMTDVWVSPALVASVSTLGIVDIGGERDTNDTSANTDLASASLRASDSFNPREVHIANARRRGVLYAAIVPNPTGNTIFGGTGLVVSLDGTNSSVLNDTALIHIALGESGARRAGGSRSAAMSQLRGALDDVRRSYLTQDEGDVLRRRDARALRAVVAGRVPLMISASRASDLMAIIALKADYPALDIIVVGAEEAHLVANELAGAGIKVIVDPHENLPDSFDSVNASLDNVVAIDAAGVDFAILGLSSFRTIKAGGLAHHAGNAVGNGLSREAAFQAITGTPARWFGIDLGTMDVGSPASLVVWDGDPLEATSAPVAMYRDGEALSLESRMTALRDRYNPTIDDDRPYKYR